MRELSSELSVWYHAPAVMSLAKSSIRSVGRSAIRKAILLMVVGFCVTGFGCRDVGTTWSDEARSPDGNWLATARSQQWGGPGTAYDATTVYLKWVKGSQAPKEVLEFSHQYATMSLKMEWVTPTHLGSDLWAKHKACRPCKSRLPSRQNQRHRHLRAGPFKNNKQQRCNGQ
jgi:hypothetical protein